MPIEARGARELAASMEARAARLRDLTPVLRVVGADTVTETDDSFRSSTSPDGSPWAPLSPVTLAKRRGSTATPLVDTGRLRNSITYQAGPRSFRFGTNVGYAGPQQFGAMIRPWGRGRERQLPARPFMPISGSGGGIRLMTQGRGGAHWTRVRSMISRYIMTGELE